MTQDVKQLNVRELLRAHGRMKGWVASAIGMNLNQFRYNVMDRGRVCAGQIEQLAEIFGLSVAEMVSVLKETERRPV